MPDAPVPFAWRDHLPTLTSSHVVLRALRDDDAPNLFEMFSHPDVMRYWSSLPLPDLDAARDLLRRIHELFRSQTLFQWGIACRDDSGLIGTCSLFHVDFIHDRAELGFALTRSNWGRGWRAKPCRGCSSSRSTTWGCDASRRTRIRRMSVR